MNEHACEQDRLWPTRSACLGAGCSSAILRWLMDIGVEETGPRSLEGGSVRDQPVLGLGASCIVAPDARPAQCIRCHARQEVAHDKQEESMEENPYQIPTRSMALESLGSEGSRNVEGCASIRKAQGDHCAGKHPREQHACVELRWKVPLAASRLKTRPSPTLFLKVRAQCTAPG